MNLAAGAAGAVVAVHLGYLAFVAVGGLLAVGRPRLRSLHLAAVAWAVAILLVGQECPLTWLERRADAWAGRPADPRGFVDRHVEDVLYPARWTPVVQGVVAVLVLAGWGLAAYRRTRRTATQPSSSAVASTDQPA